MSRTNTIEGDVLAHKREFFIFFITMIIGGLAYAITSFAYMHSTFVSKEISNNQERRIDRYETQIEKRMESMEHKLDQLLINKRGR